eukprot:3334116-Rhodomonas_salina.3
MPFCTSITATMKPSGEIPLATSPLLQPCIKTPVQGPFTEDQLKCVWAVFCVPRTDLEVLADINCLEPDPKH